MDKIKFNYWLKSFCMIRLIKKKKFERVFYCNIVWRGICWLSFVVGWMSYKYMFEILILRLYCRGVKLLFYLLKRIFFWFFLFEFMFWVVDRIKIVDFRFLKIVVYIWEGWGGNFYDLILINFEFWILYFEFLIGFYILYLICVYGIIVKYVVWIC